MIDWTPDEVASCFAKKQPSVFSVPKLWLKSASSSVIFALIKYCSLVLWRQLLPTVNEKTPCLEICSEIRNCTEDQLPLKECLICFSHLKHNLQGSFPIQSNKT